MKEHYQKLIVKFVMTLLLAMPGIAHAQQESEPETLLTLQEMQQVIKEFRDMQPGLKRLIERESELSTLLGELEKIADVDFNDASLIAENNTTSEFSPTESINSDQSTSLPIEQVQNIQPQAQSDTISAAERFRMMQMGTQPDSPSDTEVEPEELATTSTDGSDNSNLSAAERFRMMQTTVPAITRAEVTENNSNSDSLENTAENTAKNIEEVVSTSDMTNNLTEDGNGSQGMLTAAERFRLMASGQETMPVSDNNTTDNIVTEESQADEIANETNQTPSNAIETMSAAERFRQMQNAFIEADRNPTPSSEIAQNSNDTENNVVASPFVEAAQSSPQTPLSVTGSRPLEGKLLPQLAGEKPVVSNQIRGSRQIDPNQRRVKSPIFARVQNDTYYLHLFSYKDWGASKITSNWQKQKKNLPNSLSTLKIAIKEQITRTGKYNRMYLGPVLSRAEAQQHCIELQQLNYYCKVTNNI